jgi:hypothetical protein
MQTANSQWRNEHWDAFVILSTHHNKREEEKINSNEKGKKKRRIYERTAIRINANFPTTTTSKLGDNSF